MISSLAGPPKVAKLGKAAVALGISLEAENPLFPNENCGAAAATGVGMLVVLYDPWNIDF